jgi:hypothetical protein
VEAALGVLEAGRLRRGDEDRRAVGSSGGGEQAGRDREAGGPGRRGAASDHAAPVRYSYGSLLLEAGESIATVSRLLGHASEAVTLGVYVHEVERRDGGERTRAAMAQAFGPGTILERRGGESRVSVPPVVALEARNQAVPGTGGD